jgi:pimeloyl-ACP methyl ester carboxylesterase
MTWSFPYRGEIKDIDDAARRRAGGSFARLSLGRTHYETAGRSNDRAVVLIHGFSVPYFIWEPTFQALKAAGKHVVRYDLFGRGYSDRPRVRYGVDLYVQQLHELVDELGLQEPDLIGLSMGGVITAAFADRYPDQARKVTFIDPSGARPVPLSLLYEVATFPGLGELLLGLLGSEAMLRAVASDFFEPRQIQMFQKAYSIQMQYRGFKRAILSTIRSGMLGAYPDVYAQLGKLGKPVMLIWGRDDRTVPFAQSRLLLDLVPQAVLHVIPNCGHIPHYEKPEVVTPLLLEFLGAPDV